MKILNDCEKEEGLVICSSCSGRGYTEKFGNLKIKISGFTFYRDECSTCNGSGKVTWVEAIFGKEKGNPEDLWSTKPISSRNSTSSTGPK
jgi:DnaJ-class molecular chaperone